MSVGAERCGLFLASGILGKGSFKLCLVSKLFLQAQCFCFMTTLVVSGILWKWNCGVWQLGRRILLLFVRYVYCLFSSGFGHVLGLRIVALSAAMIGKFKLMIADVVFFVSSSAVAASLVGSSAAAASVAQFVKLSKAASAFAGFYMMNIADCFFVLAGFFSLRVWLLRVPHISQCAQGSFFCGSRSRSRDTTGGRGEGPASSSCACVRGCVASSQVPSRCLSQKHPVFLFDKVDEEREEKKVREGEGNTVLLLRGLQGNTMVVRCGSGWTALDLSASLRCRTSVPVHLFYLVVEAE